MGTTRYSSLWVASVIVLWTGCGGFGRVGQGQVVAYERESGVVTVIQDSNYRDPSNPRFDVLPALTLRRPAEASEMGPEPEAGKLLGIDRSASEAVVYDSATATFRRIRYVLVSEESVAPSAQRLSRAELPQVDREHRTVRLYDPRARRLMVISVGESDLDLPADTWRTGDEVRYYYKHPGRVLRLMNVSKTNLGGSGK